MLFLLVQNHLPNVNTLVDVHDPKVIWSIYPTRLDSIVRKVHAMHSSIVPLEYDWLDRLYPTSKKIFLSQKQTTKTMEIYLIRYGK